ncbi:alpha-D-ribose 1-methylphosphonate 5-triphosphate diphosphatase [Skermanella rosea]|uniref:alpha-D-ribose 1-methylphosphonate 5-triphosphate diphosphatase n=1 Tax=Skermanella rosea TaxID=1817965 RepID=UPI001933DF2A|nr:alpha-D-ribose 1-methylphosphonate 5-triphosphate diphosphatase [Skermanella rosea]UEM03945.1 alpha-D-ribose 1-methylphosphonate 5-triphosphate diphosphatase [Skermanella rosea]
METNITNARIVGRDGIATGSLSIRDGVIAAIDDSAGDLPGALDFEGDFLLPGLIEMHTDNLEKHFSPRPGVMWPSPKAAVIAHDLQVAGAGITTVFDAISVGDYDSGGERRRMLADAVWAIGACVGQGLLRADHLIHLRCEVSDAGVVEIFQQFADHPLLRLVSLMDHTPGQRQWAEMSKYRLFYRSKNWTEAEFQAHLDSRIESQHRYARLHRDQILELARPRALRLASHDDTTEDHVAEAVAAGITISEFPTTLQAARAARQSGMRVIMGAPNLVRGGSHSGNASAAELAGQGLLDGLSSDYVPSSLLHAAFLLHGVVGIPLHRAIATVTANMADMLGLPDRGVIEPGRRADLVRVRLDGDLPVVLTVWREGRRVV